MSFTSYNSWISDDSSKLKLSSEINDLNKSMVEFFSEFKKLMKEESKELKNTMAILPENNINVFRHENNIFFQSYTEFCSRYGFLNRFNPNNWVFKYVEYNESGTIIKKVFEDTTIGYIYGVCDGFLISVYDGMTSKGINTYIKIPQELQYKIDHIYNYAKSFINQKSKCDFKNLSGKVTNSHKVSITENKQMKVTKDQKELIEFLSSINNKSFDEIYMEIVKYRIKRYNRGLVTDIPFPYNKTTIDISKLQDTLLENNYEQFPSFKKWVDTVIFLDIDKEKLYNKKTK